MTTESNIDKAPTNTTWRVGLFWSSSTPSEQVKVIADGAADIESMGLHPSFIRWLAATPIAREADSLTAADYEEVLADHRRLVRELDVLLNGEDGAARHASLCDVVAQVRREEIKARSKA